MSDVGDVKNADKGLCNQYSQIQVSLLQLSAMVTLVVQGFDQTFDKSLRRVISEEGNSSAQVLCSC